MSDIQRWDLPPNVQPMWSEDDGDYVLHSDHLAEMDKIRESVRRLVGEWQSEIDGRNCIEWSAEDKGQGIRLQRCLNELSALIDGKDSSQEKL